METKIWCQSCGMPLEQPEHFGTNKDATPNAEYCAYCFQQGEFISDVTMDQMIEKNLEFLDELNKASEVKYTADQARAMMREFMPMLKRWAE